jgi:hypothetical protein
MPPPVAGTDSEELLGSPFYVGARHPRVRGEAYDELLAELLEAVKLRFGNSTLIHLQVLASPWMAAFVGLETGLCITVFTESRCCIAQDMTYLNLARYLDEYRGKFPVFSDDIQGATSQAMPHDQALHLRHFVRCRLDRRTSLTTSKPSMRSPVRLQAWRPSSWAA